MDLRDLDRIRDRYGAEFLGRRLIAQLSLSRQAFGGPGKGKIHYWNLRLLLRALRLGLRITGLQKIGERNAKSFAITEQDVAIPDLPPALDNFRILHLSDLHIDSGHELGRLLSEKIAPLEFDVVLITGDFRFHDEGACLPVLYEMEALMPALECRHGVYGVLGNHDYIEQVPMLERCGMRFLLNENSSLDVGGSRLWLVGVDDPHLYGLHDLNRASAGIPQRDVKVLLAHSPELYREASRLGISLYLCGHTHGGQFRLPGGFAPIVEASCPRRFCSGAWRFEDMAGYTSRGVGSSGIFARFFCPPEIAILRLVPAGRFAFRREAAPETKDRPESVPGPAVRASEGWRRASPSPRPSSSPSEQEAAPS